MSRLDYVDMERKREQERRGEREREKKRTIDLYIDETIDYVILCAFWHNSHKYKYTWSRQQKIHNFLHHQQSCHLWLTRFLHLHHHRQTKVDHHFIHWQIFIWLRMFQHYIIINKKNVECGNVKCVQKHLTVHHY